MAAGVQQRQALAEDVRALQPGPGALRVVCGKGHGGLFESLVEGDAQRGFHGVVPAGWGLPQ
ncbi:hypothetical protein D3C85_1846500 [compost metagenome]